MSGEISFECTFCGHNIVIDESKPPKSDAFLTCHGCGHGFSDSSAIRDALVIESRAEAGEIISLTLGNTPTWEP